MDMFYNIRDLEELWSNHEEIIKFIYLSVGTVTRRLKALCSPLREILFKDVNDLLAKGVKFRPSDGVVIPSVLPIHCCRLCYRSFFSTATAATPAVDAVVDGPVVAVAVVDATVADSAVSASAVVDATIVAEADADIIDPEHLDVCDCVEEEVEEMEFLDDVFDADDVLGDPAVVPVAPPVAAGFNVAADAAVAGLVVVDATTVADVDSVAASVAVVMLSAPDPSLLFPPSKSPLSNKHKRLEDCCVFQRVIFDNPKDPPMTPPPYLLPPPPNLVDLGRPPQQCPSHYHSSSFVISHTPSPIAIAHSPDSPSSYPSPPSTPGKMCDSGRRLSWQAGPPSLADGLRPWESFPCDGTSFPYHLSLFPLLLLSFYIFLMSISGTGPPLVVHFPLF